MAHPEGPVTAADGSRIELSLSWLTAREAITYKDELDRQLTRWRFRRMPLDSHITAAMTAACAKTFPHLRVGVAPKGYRLESFGAPGQHWYTAAEFKRLITDKALPHEEYLLAKLAYGGATGKPSLELRYAGGSSRFAKIHNLYDWGIHAETPAGFRNFRWEKITAVRILMSSERVPPSKLQLISVENSLVSTWLRWDHETESFDEFA